MPHVEQVAVAPAEPTSKDAGPESERQQLNSVRPTTGARLRALVAAAPTLLTDAGVLAFALWTVMYHLAFLINLAPATTFLIWVVGCVVAFGAWLGHRRRVQPSAAADAVQQETAEDATYAYSRPLLAVVLGAGTVAAVTAGLTAADDGIGAGIPWWIPGGFGALAGVGALLLARGRWLTTPARVAPAAAASPLSSAYALIVAVLAAVSGLFFARNSVDDAFFVGKSVWVAERNQVPLRDFLFTDGVAPAMNSQPPVPSIEVFYGAFAHVFGLHAASATWYIVMPVMSVLAVLALWRLVQRWAPGRAALAFTVAVAYLYLVAGQDAALGTFHLTRLHQGKTMFVAAVVPLMWVYLTDWFDSRSCRGLILIAALSIVATGLSTTSAIVLPLLVGGAMFAMIVVGRWRDALLAGAAALVYPVGATIWSRLTAGPITENAAAAFYDAEITYRRTVLFGVLGVIGGLALWLGPLIARRRTPQLLVAGSTLAMSVLLFPGVLELINSLTGIGVVLWRTPWMFALPAVIGILCTVDLPRLRVFGSVAIALALVAGFAILGTPMWSPKSYVAVHEQPVWKLPQQRKTIVFWMARLDRPDGVVLAPSTLMHTAPMVTSRMRVVSPNDRYLPDYGMNTPFVQDRLKLVALANGRTDLAPVPELAGAIERLDVTTICVYSSNQVARELAPTLGFEQFATRKRPGAMTCFRRG
ncbi:DUF6077 domain-containing protein [Micromonospora sp. NPDC005174]|uniref:DUF6077 domain-containing protein n=1 Tax=Micromonospora sp. NPDC005174 TaxID=3157018 RepID=UPI0033A136B1